MESDLHAGGQLVKQTHKFFGSKDEYAGTRGFKIADMLMDEIKSLGDKVEIRTNTTVTGFFHEDGVYTAMEGEESSYRVKREENYNGYWSAGGSSSSRTTTCQESTEPAQSRHL